MRLVEVCYRELRPGDRFKRTNVVDIDDAPTYTVQKTRDAFGDYYAIGGGLSSAPCADTRVYKIEDDNSSFAIGDKVRIRAGVSMCVWGMSDALKLWRDKGSSLTVVDLVSGPGAAGVGVVVKSYSIRGPNITQTIEASSLELVSGNTRHITLELTEDQAVTLRQVCRKCRGNPETSRRGDMDRIEDQLTDRGSSHARSDKQHAGAGPQSLSTMDLPGPEQDHPRRCRTSGTAGAGRASRGSAAGHPSVTHALTPAATTGTLALGTNGGTNGTDGSRGSASVPQGR